MKRKHKFWTSHRPFGRGPHAAATSIIALLLDFKNGIYQQTRTRTNLLLWSQGMDNAAWGKSSSGVVLPIVTADAVTAPDGTLTAERIDYPAVPTSGQYSQIGELIAVTAQPYTFSVWLKGAVGGEQVYLNTTPNGTTYSRTLATLTTAWQRFTLTYTPTAASWYWQLGVDLRDASETAKSAQTIHAWGAQLEAAPAASAYIPTTSAAVSVTENVTVNGAANVNQLYGYTYSRSGAKEEATSTGATAFAANVPAIIPGTGYFARPAYTNLLLWSQDFTNATWTKTNTTAAVNAIAPDGSSTANTYTAVATTQADAVQNVSGSASTTYTVSAFMKYGTSQWGYFQINATGAVKAFFIAFDLINGVVGATQTLVAGLTVNSTAMTPVGNGWYRCSITYTLATDSTGQAIYCGIADTSTTRSATAGKYYYIWQAQVVQASDPGPIIVTTSATAAVGADAMVLNLSNKTYSAVYTFDDASTQTISTTVSNGAFSLPDYPTLNRPTVQKVTLT